MRSRAAADKEGGSSVSMTTDPCITPLKGTSSRGSGPVDPRSWRFGPWSFGTRGRRNKPGFLMAPTGSSWPLSPAPGY